MMVDEQLTMPIFNEINWDQRLNPPLADPPHPQWMSGDQIWWQEGKHHRDLAMWLREITRKCHLPNPQQELLDLARRYERRADHMDRNAAFIGAKFRTSHR